MIVLDIAIGIVLIYFLYSLLSSIIAEIISSWIGMRARILKQGIENILNDKQIGSPLDFRKWLQDIFMVEDNNFRYTTAGKFYEEPTIKYLAKPGEHAWYSLRNRKPAYISPENFVITALNMLSNKGRGISEWDKIKFAIETNALHLEPETLKMFQDMVKRSNDSYKNFVDLLQHHFSDTMDRVNGWYKRKIGTIIFYIGLFLCTILNVDTFQIVNTLSKDKEKRLQIAELAERVIEKKSKIDSLMSKKDSLDELNYKKQAHIMVKESVIEANDILATGWSFKIGPRKEDICISNDPSCHNCITENQAMTILNLMRKNDSLTVNAEWLESLKNKKNSNIVTEGVSLDAMKNMVQDMILKADSFQEKKVLVDSIAKKIQSLQVKDISLIDEKITLLHKMIQTNVDSINEITGLDFLQYNFLVDNCHYSKIVGTGYPDVGGKALFILKAMVPWKPKFWGIVLTALALTLGAQFWFDLLKKLVSLRSTGVKPEENEDKKRQVSQLKLEGEKVTSKDPVEIAISENRAYWESLPGFIGYNVILENNGKRYIEVSLDKNVINQKPDDYYVSVFIAENLNNVDIVVTYLLTNKAEFQNEYQIMESNLVPSVGHLYIESTNTYGTPACIVFNKNTRKLAILTCGHVARPMKYSAYLNETDTLVKICVDPNTNKYDVVGIVKNIVMSSYADGGLIDIENTKSIGNIVKLHHIESVSFRDEGRKFYLINIKKDKKEARLIDSRRYFAFNDKGEKDAKFVNLLMFKPLTDGDFMSLPGDSGALVYNERNIPVAVIMGGSTEQKNGIKIKYSYAIRLSDLKEILQFDLLT